MKWDEEETGGAAETEREPVLVLLRVSREDMCHCVTAASSQVAPITAASKSPEKNPKHGLKYLLLPPSVGFSTLQHCRLTTTSTTSQPSPPAGLGGGWGSPYRERSWVYL